MMDAQKDIVQKFKVPMDSNFPSDKAIAGLAQTLERMQIVLTEAFVILEFLKDQQVKKLKLNN
jgi:hypothetical protein